MAVAIANKLGIDLNNLLVVASTPKEINRKGSSHWDEDMVLPD